MIPEEDYDTWKVVVTTVTDDISSFGEVLPDVQRLMNSIIETNSLPSELNQFTDDFVEDAFPNLVNSLLETVTPMIKQDDNANDSEIVNTFFRLAIKLCTSKISTNLIENVQKNDELLQNYKKLVNCSIKMIDIINKIFDRIDLDTNPNQNEKMINQDLVNYFQNDLDGVDKIYLDIDNISHLVDQRSKFKSEETSSNDPQNSVDDNLDELLNLESLQLSKLVILIQKVIFTTIYTNKTTNSNNQDENIEKEDAEIDKILKYYESINSLIHKSFPIFSKIADINLRKFDMSHLDPIFDIITKTFPINLTVSQEDDYPLLFNLWEPDYSNIISMFLKSQFFDKHLYILKTISNICTNIDDNYQNNAKYFTNNNQNLHLRYIFIEKDSILNVISYNLDQIQNLHYNKEFSELIGNIYAFVIKNSSDIVSIDHIKNFWSQVQFVFAANRSSFYKIFEKIIKEMNSFNCNDLIDFILIHASQKRENFINTNFLHFLSNVSQNLRNEEYKDSFSKIQNFFWSISFDENEDSKEMKNYAQKKLIYLSENQSNELFERLVKEKLQLIQNLTNDEKNDDNFGFILKLLSNSYRSGAKMNDDECSKVVQICTSNLNNENAIALLTNIFRDRKITLEKDQIEKLSNGSNKFLRNIFDSSNFSDDDIENLLLSAKNVNHDLYQIVYDYIKKNNKHWEKSYDYLTYLPFEKEDFLWKFALVKSNIQKMLIKLLCDIYSNNDGVLLTDKQMINIFLDRFEKEMDNEKNRESLLLLLKKFISTIDKTNPNLSSIQNHEKFKDKFIKVAFEGIKDTFYFSKKNISLVVYYTASKILNVPINQLTLVYEASPLPVYQKLKIFSNLRNVIKLRPDYEMCLQKDIINHIRTVSPLTQISKSNLMSKLMTLMLSSNQDTNNNNILINILNDLPTYEPIFQMLNHFDIMKEINFEKLFPINHPKFFLYTLQSLKLMKNNLKDDFIRANGIEYFIDALTKVNSSSLIHEIIDCLAFILDSKDAIDKYSNKLFEVLLRVCLCIPEFDDDNCLNLLKKLNPTNFPQFRSDFQEIELIEPEKDQFDENNSNYFNNIEDLIDMQYIHEKRQRLDESDYFMDPILLDTMLLRRHMMTSKNKKVEDAVQIDSETPFSDLIFLSILAYFVKKNIKLSSSLELKTENLLLLKQLVKNVYCKLPIPPEYFECCFKYLNSSNYTDFYVIYLPHAIPLTETFTNFIIENLDTKSKYLPFIMKFLQDNIDKITDIEKKNIIYDFIFANFFVLDGDFSIDDKIFKSALEIASKAPFEKIIKEISKIGIPEIDKFNLCGKDFNRSTGPTGLKNLGFTCYFNSILQQFYHCLSLRKTLIEYKGDDPLFKELGSLFSQMKNESLKYVSPQKVVENWTCWDGEKLNPRIQQDAAEFTIMMIDKLSPLIPNSMFNGKLLFKIEGINNDEGQFISERNEPFSVLILPINESTTIEDCLKSFNNPSFFTNKNQYFADTLQRKIDAKQSDFIQDLPDHLILQLKRFDYDYAAGTRKKINSKVSISKEIDVSSICEFKDQNKITKYKLAGIIQHMGSAMGGHYYSFVMDRNTKEWYKFNDTEVTLVTIDDVIEKSNGYDSNAYLLFYDKIDLNEVDDSTNGSKNNNDNDNDSYQFFLNEQFSTFLNEISKRRELHEFAIKLILKIIPHENFVIPETYFKYIKDRLEKEPEFAAKEQEEINDFKFLILNKCEPTNFCVVENILDPMFNNSVSLRLLKLAIETLDYAAENLLDSFFFFRVVYTIIKATVQQKSSLMKEEEKNKELINILNESLDQISQKTVHILKYGIKEYNEKHPNLAQRNIIQTLNLSVIVRLFNVVEIIPDDYVELLKDPEFIKTFYLSKNPTVFCLMKNYIRAREMKLFDVDSFLKQFFMKESQCIDNEDLIDSIFIVFGKEAFQFGRLLKFKLHDFDGITQNDFIDVYPLACKNDKVRDFLMENLECWVPNFFMHDARNPNSKQYFADFPMKSSNFEKLELFELNLDDVKRSKTNVLKFLHCLFGCLKEMKEIIMKEDFSKSLSFAKYRYKAVPLLLFIQSIVKTYRFHFENEINLIDFTELIDFGEFLLLTGHSHPFDPHITLILKIVRDQPIEKLLYDSIPDKNIMMVTDNLKRIPTDRLEKYMKILIKIIKNNMTFSDEFYPKLFMMIVFNLKNLLSVYSNSAKLYDLISSIVIFICERNKDLFIHYLDSNFEFCLLNGLVSVITGLKYLNIKRPISKFFHLKDSLSMIEIASSIIPSFIYDAVSINENDDDTLFDDISIVARFLSQNENNEEHENYRSVVWNYLINNTNKRIIECDEKNRLNLQMDLFNQFDKNYNYNFIDLIFDFKKKNKEIDYLTNLLIQFIPHNDNNSFENSILDRFVYLSKYSLKTLSGLFDILILKLPEMIKNENFISDVLSNEICSKNWKIVEKLCSFSFNGKERNEIVSILKNSRIVTRLLNEIDVLNFIYDKGIIEEKFKLEDEEQLSTVIVPFRIIMKYEKKVGKIIGDDERSQIIKESSSLLNKLKSCRINCKTLEEVIEEISQFIQ